MGAEEPSDQLAMLSAAVVCIVLDRGVAACLEEWLWEVENAGRIAALGGSWLSVGGSTVSCWVVRP